MEVRTIYVAFPGTSCEKTFETEEECLNYEKMETPEMWDEKGNPTFNGEEAMFVKVDEDMMPVLFDKYGNNFLHNFVVFHHTFEIIRRRTICKNRNHNWCMSFTAEISF